MSSKRTKDGHWRDQRPPDRDGRPGPVSEYPWAEIGGGGDPTQSNEAAWAALGEALGKMTRDIDRNLDALRGGYARALRPDRNERVIRAFVEWQRYLARLPRWKRRLVKLWYSF